MSDNIVGIKSKTPKGGKRTGAGRKSREDKLSNYNRAIKMLDDSIEQTLQVLIDGLFDEDSAVRIKCAETLLKKTLPDKKRSEITGADGGAIKISPGDVKLAITEAVTDLEGMIAENKERKLLEEN